MESKAVLATRILSISLLNNLNLSNKFRMVKNSQSVNFYLIQTTMAENSTLPPWKETPTKWVWLTEPSSKMNLKSWRRSSSDGLQTSLPTMLLRLLYFPNGSDNRLHSLESQSPRNCLISITLLPRNTPLKDGRIKWEELQRVLASQSKLGEDSISSPNSSRPPAVLVDGGVLPLKLVNSFNSELWTGNNMLQSQSSHWWLFITQMKQDQFHSPTSDGWDF